MLPQRLVDGYAAFLEGRFPQESERYRRLGEDGQSPKTMVISCCDSRVSPEVIFDVGPGEFFIVRNVANLVPPYETGGNFHGVSAALEFATLNLRVKHIVIMGHSGCGGVKAALEQSAARQTDAMFISKWMSMLDEARLRVMTSHQGPARSELLSALEQEGIKVSLANLRTFPCIQALEGKGRLALHGAYFDIRSGDLFVLNESTGSYYRL